MQSLRSLVATLALLLVPVAATAQSRDALPTEAPQRAVAELDLEAFAEAAQAEAEAAGQEAPSLETIRATFEALDTDGSGTVSDQEMQNGNGRDCRGRGMCAMGRCFCMTEAPSDPQPMVEETAPVERESLR